MSILKRGQKTTKFYEKIANNINRMIQKLVNSDVPCGTHW